MRRFLLILLLSICVLASLVTGAAWYLLKDEAFLKQRLSAFVLQRTGRELALDGPLRLTLGRTTTFDARNIRLQNAAWAGEPDMASLGHLQLAVDIPSLLGDTPVLPLLLIEDCSISLSQNTDGTANWDLLPKSDEPAGPAPPSRNGLPVRLLDAELHRCRLSHEAPGRARPLQVGIDSFSQRLEAGRRWQVRGAGLLNDETFSFDGWLEPAGALLQGGSLEHQLQARFGDILLQSAGTVQDARTGAGANVTVGFSGPDITKVLDIARLPPVSEGAFDFQLHLDSEGGGTRLNLEGDLGSLDIDAEGLLDRLVGPQSGTLRLSISGPNLEALGTALSVQGLVPEPFDLQADLEWANGIAQARSLILSTAGDRLEAAGTVGETPDFPGSDLDISLSSKEVGRWGGRFGLPARIGGPLHIEGRLVSDATGLFSVDASVEYQESTLRGNGALGRLAGPLEPDLRVKLESPDAATLAQSLNVEGVPAVPAHIEGRLGMAGGIVNLTAVQIGLGPHKGLIDGRVNPVSPYTGSTLQVRLEIPDAADLGTLFGRENLPKSPVLAQGTISRPDQRIRVQGATIRLGDHQLALDGYLDPSRPGFDMAFDVGLQSPDIATLSGILGGPQLPHEPLDLKASTSPEGDKGFAFRISQGEVGNLRLSAEGRIADLARPMILDAEFDVRLPSLSILSSLAPNARLPDLPFAAVGRLRNETDYARLEQVELMLGSIEAKVGGEVYPDWRFDLNIEAQGPDAAQLRQWAGERMPAEPFSVHANAAGYLANFRLNELNARLGRSEASGELEVGLGHPKRVTGDLTSRLLDINPWRTGEKGPAAPEADTDGPYVFGDQPVRRIVDRDLDLDLRTHIALLDFGEKQLRELEIHARLAGRRLELNPVSLRGLNGALLTGHGSLDGSGPVPLLDLELHGNDLRLGLSAVEGQEVSSIPATELHLELRGAGATRRELAAGLNGKLRVYAGSGLVASAGVRLLFSDFLTELFNTLNPFAEKRDYTRLDCTVAAADVINGLVTVAPVVINTEEVTIFSGGTIDLHTEKLDLSFNTKPRKGLGISAGTLINPWIKVGGSLKHPQIELDPERAAIASGAAVATGGLSLVAKSFSDRFLSSKDPCGDARKEIDKREAQKADGQG